MFNKRLYIYYKNFINKFTSLFRLIPMKTMKGYKMDNANFNTFFFSSSEKPPDETHLQLQWTFPPSHASSQSNTESTSVE